MSAVVQCEKHGAQPETFVCDHVVQSLRDGQPRGFFWAVDSDDEYPDAWCGQCNDRLAASGGEWTDALEATAKVRLLCARCYEAAKELNGL